MFTLKKAFLKLVVLLYEIHSLNGGSYFLKDQSIDAIVFPPVNTRSMAGIPQGHLRPLGWQKKPDGKVREEKECPTAHTFYLRYIKTSRPAVLRAALNDTPILKLWDDDEYLKQTYGPLNLTVTVKRQIQFENYTSKKKMPLRLFLLDYMYEDWYLSNTLPKEMMRELPLPKFLSCGTYKDRLTESELWMSSGGTTSFLHSHSNHNVHCVLFGRKDFILIENKHKDVFKVTETYPNSGEGHSAIDMEMINVYKHPKISKTPWIWAKLFQGDCIFVPAGYLHQVRSYGRGISYTVQFAPSVDFDSSDCIEGEFEEELLEKKKKKKKKKDKKKTDKSKKHEEKEKEDEKKPKVKQLSLADVKFMWTYVGGHKKLMDPELNSESLRKLLLLVVKDGDQLHKQQFEHMYKEAIEGAFPTDEAEEAFAKTKRAAKKVGAKDAFQLLTMDENRDHLTREELVTLGKGRLKNVAKLLNDAHDHVHDEL